MPAPISRSQSAQVVAKPDAKTERTPPRPKLVSVAVGQKGSAPVTLTLGNVPPGGSLQVINLSRNPAADFSGSCVVTLAQQAADGNAVFTLDGHAAERLQPRAGDVLAVRVVNGCGGASPALNVAVAAANGRPAGSGLFGVFGAVHALADDRPGAVGNPTPTRVDARKPVLVASRVQIAVWTQQQRDAARELSRQGSALRAALGLPNLPLALSREQLLKASESPLLSPLARQGAATLANDPAIFDQAATMAAHDNAPAGVLTSDDLDNLARCDAAIQLLDAFEPGCTVMVTNLRTGKAQAGHLSTIEIAGRATFLYQGAQLHPGDVLEVKVVDHNNVESDPLHVTFDPSSPRGVSRGVSALQTRTWNNPG